MEPLKIVCRFKDGRTAKGRTSNFSPALSSFLLVPEGGGDKVLVDLHTVKAVFFVRDFVGNKDRQDRTCFAPNQPFQGRRVEVEFTDGERVVGSTPSYSREMQGFFIFPADTDSNTTKIYAVASSVRSVRWE